MGLEHEKIKLNELLQLRDILDIEEFFPALLKKVQRQTFEDICELLGLLRQKEIISLLNQVTPEELYSKVPKELAAYLRKAKLIVFTTYNFGQLEGLDSTELAQLDVFIVYYLLLPLLHHLQQLELKMAVNEPIWSVELGTGDLLRAAPFFNDLCDQLQPLVSNATIVAKKRNETTSIIEVHALFENEASQWYQSALLCIQKVLRQHYQIFLTTEKKQHELDSYCQSAVQYFMWHILGVLEGK